MNTPSLNNSDNIKNKFDELLKFKNEKEETDHDATMLSLQFISAFNKLMGTSVTKKNIADAIGTSKSYVTQVFNGSKLLNLETIIKIQKALDARVKINLIVNNAETDFSAKINKGFNGNPVPNLRKNGKHVKLQRENSNIALNKTSRKSSKEKLSS